jgi:hypothetical protein
MKKFYLIAAMLLMTTVLFAQTWTPQTSPVTTGLNSVSAISRQVCWMSGAGGKVVRTTNGGTTWSLLNTGVTDGLYCIFALDANNCWIGAEDGALYHTTNGGTNWAFVALSPTAVFINVIHFFDANYGFVQGDPVTSQWRYYITTNGGANWTLPPNTPASVGTEAGWNNAYAALDTGNIWWGTNNTKIWKGGLRGQFTAQPTTGINTFGIWFNNASTGVAIMTNASYGSIPMNRTVNGGTNWTVTGFTPPGTTAYGIKGILGTGFIWISTTTVIQRSTDNGLTFATQYTSSSDVLHLGFVDQGRGWASLNNGGILIYNDPNYTGIGSGNNELPQGFVLEQNYPNPFNPTTTIRYSIPKASKVTIKVYNLIGNEVMTLIDQFKPAGDYSTFVDAKDLASGVYFYRLVADGFTDSKKMTLIK